MDSVIIDGKHQRWYLRNFSTSYQMSPTFQIVYSGRDHRSWIDVIVSYEETFENELLINNKYPYQSMSKSAPIIHLSSNSKDQVLAFNFGSRLKGINIYYKSLKKFRVMYSASHKIKAIKHKSYNLLLNGYLHLPPTPGSLDRQIAFQGEGYELKLYCEEVKTCPEFKLHLIPDQLIKYRDDSHSSPQNCLKQNQMIIPDDIYCLNFSSDSLILNYIYITTPPSMVEEMLVHYMNNEGKVSWNDASSMCQHMGGLLPIFRSKSELDEFFALITFSHYVPPQDKIFISLSTSEVLIHFIFLNYMDFSVMVNSVGVKLKLE